MKKSILFFGLSLSVLACSPVLADEYKFNCAPPSKVQFSDNLVVAYVPYDASSGMPEKLSGSGVGGVPNAGWEGLVQNVTFTSIDTSKTTFNQVAVGDSLLCYYYITGKDIKTGQDRTVFLTLEPGNLNYRNLYNYSLSNGSTYSNDINVQIIAKSLQ